MGAAISLLLQKTYLNTWFNMVDALDGCLDTSYDQSSSLFGTKSDATKNDKSAQSGRSIVARQIAFDQQCQYEQAKRVQRRQLQSPRYGLRNGAQSLHSCATNSGYSRKVDGGFYNH